MAKSKDMKVEMWERLSSRPETLKLDVRVDEEPEDFFVRLCNSGKESEVFDALRTNICEIVGAMEKETEDALRFMQRAIRLCDVIGATCCKPFLEMLLLHESKDYWGDDLEGLHELASRTLSGMPKGASDFSYWSCIANKHNESLPYALNAMIEISPEEGLVCFLKTFNFYQERKRHKEVDWKVILEIAIDTHGKKKIGKALDKIFQESPVDYERFVHHFGLPELSKMKERSIKDIVGYSANPIDIPKVKSDISSVLGAEYVISKANIPHLESLDDLLDEKSIVRKKSLSLIASIGPDIYFASADNTANMLEN